MSRRRARTCLYAATFSLVAAAPPLLASPYDSVFSGPSGSYYSDPANWYPAPPGNGNSASVSPPTTALTLNLDAAPNNVTLGDVFFQGADRNKLLVINATAPAFTADNIFFLTNVTVNQTAGSIRTTSYVDISGPNTSYTLSGTASLSGGGGGGGLGIGDGVSFVQSGGTVTAYGGLGIGSYGAYYPTSYALSAGSLGADYIGIGAAAPVSFTQTGGSVGSAHYLHVGANTSYSLSAGTLATAQDALYVGSSPLTGYSDPDAGSTFAQSGGAVSLGQQLVQTAPALVVNANRSGAPALYSMTGGNLDFPRQSVMIVGDTTAGTFAQSGGTVGNNSTASDATAPTHLVLGFSAGGTGTYSLSASASLYTRSLDVGFSGSGTLVQTGGSLTIFGGASGPPTLSLATNPGSSASYSLSGTGALLTYNLLVGNQGSASFVQSGGSASATGAVTINPASSYTLSGTGTLSTPLLTNNGTFVQTGGTFTGTADSETYDLVNNGTYSLSGTAAVNAHRFITSGTLSMTGGTVTTNAISEETGFAADGTVTQSGGSILAGNANIAIPSGTSTSASYSLSGTGSLSGTRVRIGSGPVTFNQSGGSISGALVEIGFPSNTSPTSFSISGGSVFGTSVAVTNTDLAISGGSVTSRVDLTLADSTVTQTGGTLATTNSLSVNPNSSYSLSGNGSASADTLTVNGHVTQSGGTATVTSSLNVADSSVYNQFAGSLTAKTVTNNGTFYMQSPASFTMTGTTFTNNGSATFDGTQSWPAGSTFANTLVAYFHSDPGSAAAATLNVTSASPDWAPVVFDAPATHLASLALSSATHASIPAATGPARLLSARSLSITDTAQLDLTNNTLSVDYGAAASPADAIRGYLFDTHLTSSLADATHRLGYLDSGSSIDFHLTLAGDANLDGRVTGDDYTLMDRAYASNLPDAHWIDGDFNYDGIITSADYLLIDTTYGQAHGLSPEFLSDRESRFGDAYVQTLIAAVPEPGTAALLGMSVGTMAARRRRRK